MGLGGTGKGRTAKRWVTGRDGWDRKAMGSGVDRASKLGKGTGRWWDPNSYFGSHTFPIITSLK